MNLINCGDGVMDNQSRFTLKKYRGLLLAKIADTMTTHDETFHNHVAVTLPQTCTMCDDLLELQDELKSINQQLQLIKNGVPPLTVRMCHYYLAVDIKNQQFIIRAQNQDNVAEIVKYNRMKLHGRPQQIEDLTAYKMVKQFEPNAGRDKVAFLRQHPEFIGIVVSQNG